MKISLILVYFGQWPVWFPAFLQSCKYNSKVTWLIFTDCNLPQIPIENVIFIPFTLKKFNILASKKLGFEVDLTRPYKLCDYKPTYGLIFEDYIQEFDFWGHCDLDVVWGDIRTFVTDRILEEYDIITSKVNKIAGHFTLYRNADKTNNLFTLHPEYQTFLISPKSLFFDELEMEQLAHKMVEEGKLKVYWHKWLQPLYTVHLKKLTNAFFWEKGKLYDIHGEIMYLHFRTWKKSLQKCYFELSTSPENFYVSYSHIGLNRSDKTPIKAIITWEKWRLYNILRPYINWVKIIKKAINRNPV